MSLLTGTSTSRISQMVVRPWDADLVASFFSALQLCKIAESLSEQWNQQKMGGETMPIEKAHLIVTWIQHSRNNGPKVRVLLKPRRSVVLIGRPDSIILHHWWI